MIMGMIYQARGDYEKALSHHQDALTRPRARWSAGAGAVQA